MTGERYEQVGVKSTSGHSSSLLEGGRSATGPVDVSRVCWAHTSARIAKYETISYRENENPAWDQ